MSDERLIEAAARAYVADVGRSGALPVDRSISKVERKGSDVRVVLRERGGELIARFSLRCGRFVPTALVERGQRVEDT